MPHGTYAKPMTCHVAHMPCHVALGLGLCHATWHQGQTYAMPHVTQAKLMLATHHLGLICHPMWHIGQAQPCHMAPRLNITMPHGTYARSKTCHMVTRRGLIHAMWHLGYVRTCHMAHRLGLGHATWHIINLFPMPHGNMIKLGVTS